MIEPELARSVARRFVRELGGPAPSPEALGRLPLSRILQAQRTTMSEMVDLHIMMVFQPVVDGDLIPERPIDAVRRGAASDIPLLVGTTLDEWKLMRPIDGGFNMTEGDLVDRFQQALPAFPRAPEAEAAVWQFRAALGARGARTGSGDVWTAFQTARAMHLPASRLAEAQADGGGSARTYLFTWRPPAARHALGACHCLDIPFVFGSIQHPLALPFTGFNPSAMRLSRKMQQSWIGFARDGHPGHDRLPDWGEYEPRNRSTMILGRRCSLDPAPLEAERRVLESWSAAQPSGDLERLATEGGA